MSWQMLTTVKNRRITCGTVRVTEWLGSARVSFFGCFSNLVCINFNRKSWDFGPYVYGAPDR